MSITFRLPWKQPETANSDAIEVISDGRVASSYAFSWAGDAVQMDPLARLRAGWYPRVQHYLKNIGIFSAAARDVAQAIAELRWSANDESYGDPPTDSDSPEWKRLAESLSTLDWYRAAHQVYGVGAVHIVAWPDADTMLRFEVYSLSELTPPLSGFGDEAPQVVDYDGGAPRPLWPAGTPREKRPRIVTVYRPDGEYGRSVWSPAQSLLDDFEALLLMSIADKAYDLHRITGAGILFIPNSIANAEILPEDRAKGITKSPAIAKIMKMIQEPMANPYSLQRVTPAIITGPDAAGDQLKHFMFDRGQNPSDFVTRRDARWRSIAVALDQPAGRIINSEDQSKFYNAQTIDFMAMRATVAIAKIISQALMRELFHKILRDQWHDQKWRSRTLTPTWDHLQPEPDRTDEALKLLDAGLITLEYAQEMAKIPDNGRAAPGSQEWFLLIDWRRRWADAQTGTPAPTGELLGQAVPPSTGPAAPGTAPDGAGAPDLLDGYDPLAEFDTKLAAAKVASIRADMAKLAARTAAKTAAAQDHSGGVMVSLTIPADVARLIAVPGGESPDDMHVTIAYLGKTDTLDRATIERALRRVTWEPLEGTIGGIGRFPGSHIEGLQAVWVPVDVPGLSEFRNLVVRTLAEAGIGQGSEHGYTPHVTLDYVTPDQPNPPPVPSINVGWSGFTFTWDGERVKYPFMTESLEDARAAAVEHASAVRDATMLRLRNGETDPAVFGAYVAALKRVSMLQGLDGAYVAAASDVLTDATDPHPLSSVVDELNAIDRELRAKIAGAAEAAMRAMLRKVGAKLARLGKRAALADVPAWMIPEHLGPAACTAMLAAANDDPITGSFDDLGDNVDDFLKAAFVASLLALRVDPNSATGVAAAAKAATARADAVAHLKSSMTTLARQRVFSPKTGEVRGEAVSTLVPSGIASQTAAIAGGSPVEMSASGSRLAAAERPATGLATGPMMMDVAGTLSVDPFVIEYTWKTGAPAHPFKPHADLAGVTVLSTDDARLAVDDAGKWLEVNHYYPWDHAGCQCNWDVKVKRA